MIYVVLNPDVVEHVISGPENMEDEIGKAVAKFDRETIKWTRQNENASPKLELPEGCEAQDYRIVG